MTIGEKIRWLRECYGFTQKQVGRMSGCSAQYIHKVERGDVKIPKTVVKGLLPHLSPENQLLLQSDLKKAIRDQED